MNLSVWICSLCVWLAVTQAHAASQKMRYYALVIGYNQPVVVKGKNPLLPLSYADDDAAAFYGYMRTVTDKAVLLSTLDQETQVRYKEVVETAHAPTLRELKRVLESYQQDMHQDRASGVLPVLYFFYSGHGQRNNQGVPFLALADEPLTQSFLFESIFKSLEAYRIHVIIDACEAESVVQVKGDNKKFVFAKTEPVDQALVARLFEHTSLKSLPHVGAVLASSRYAPAHEFNLYAHGVLTHHLLSALRGAADVNQDGHIEYSEIHAFLAAAGRTLLNSQMTFDFVVHAVMQDVHTPMIMQTQYHDTDFLLYTGHPLGHFYIENMRGVRILDAHAESSFAMRLALPAQQAPFFAYHGTAQYVLRAQADKHTYHVDQAGKTMAINKGALEDNHLFNVPFGPFYYRGFIGRLGEVGIDVTQQYLSMVGLNAFTPPAAHKIWLHSVRAQTAVALFGISTASLLASFVCGGLAIQAYQDFNHTELEKSAAQAKARYDTFSRAFFGTLGVSLGLGVVGFSVFPWHLNQVIEKEAK